MKNILLLTLVLSLAASVRAQEIAYLTDPNVSGLQRQAVALHERGSHEKLYTKVQGQIRENFTEFTAMAWGDAEPEPVSLTVEKFLCTGDIEVTHGDRSYVLPFYTVDPYELGWDANREASFVEITFHTAGSADRLRLYAEDYKFTEMMQQRLGWYVSLIQAKTGQ